MNSEIMNQTIMAWCRLFSNVFHFMFKSNIPLVFSASILVYVSFVGSGLFQEAYLVNVKGDDALNRMYGASQAFSDHIIGRSYYPQIILSAKSSSQSRAQQKCSLQNRLIQVIDRSRKKKG